MKKLFLLLALIAFQPSIKIVIDAPKSITEYSIFQDQIEQAEVEYSEPFEQVITTIGNILNKAVTIASETKELIANGIFRVSLVSEAHAQEDYYHTLLRIDDNIEEPNQVTSKTAHVPFTAGGNDWQGRYYAIETAAGYWMAVWVEGTNHSDYNETNHKVNIHFSNNEGVTWSANNTYIGGAAVTGFPLVPPGGSSTGFVDFTIIRCPNDDLVIIAQNRGSNPTVWNAVNFSQHQYRSTDDGQTWAYEYDYCNHIGFTTTLTKAKIQGLFENMVVGNTVYLTHCEIRADLNDTRISLYKSTDNCATWTLVSHPVEFDELDPDATASAIAHLGAGKYMCILRTQDLGSGMMKTSDDAGLTWNAATEFDVQLGYVGIHDPKVKNYSDFFLLYGRDCKKIINSPSSALFERNSWWTTTDLFSTSAKRHYLDPFYVGTGAVNQGDAGYTRALQKADGSFMFFGYYGTNFDALIYKYDVSHTPTPSNEHYSNTEYFPETLTSDGFRLQLNRDNIEATTGAPALGGIAIFNRAHNVLATGSNAWTAGGTNKPELTIINNRGWCIFNGTDRFLSTTAVGTTLFSNSFSIGAWVWPDDGNPAATNMILKDISVFAGGATLDQVQFFIVTDGRIRFTYTINNTQVTAETANAIFANGSVATPKHIAATFTSGGLIRIYVDGVLQGYNGANTGDISALTMASYTNGTNQVSVGQRQFDATTFDVGFFGKLREVTCQPVVWSASDILNGIMLNFVWILPFAKRRKIKIIEDTFKQAA